MIWPTRIGRLRREERGAVLIYVAVALIGLLAFSALAVDVGVMMVGRRQAQNAADAGALAGAITIAYGKPPDDPDDINDPVYVAARSVAASAAKSNPAWGQAPRVIVGTDARVVGFGGGEPCPPEYADLADKCVKVDAYRNQEGDEGNAPLPTFFANLVGVSQQGAKATATAVIRAANYVPRCIKPFALPDRWLENGTTPSVFAQFFDGPPDVYDPEAVRWRFPDDYGSPVILHTGSFDNPTSSWAQLTDISGHGTAGVSEAITGCVGVSAKINPDFPDSIALKEGVSAGLKLAVDEVAAAFPLTVWDHTPSAGSPYGQLVCGDPGGCGGSNYRCGAIPIYNPGEVTHPMSDLHIIDFVGVYIEGMANDKAILEHHPELVAYAETFPGGSGYAELGKLVIGHLVPYAGLYSGTQAPGNPSSFLRTVTLVR